MKFNDKITLSCMAAMTLCFSLGATFMIYQNHAHLFQSTIDQNIQAHELETFSLESKLTQDALSHLTDYGANEKTLRNRAQYYITQFTSYSKQPKAYYALSLDDQFVYVSNEKQLFQTYPKHPYNMYQLVNYQGKKIMMIHSDITTGNFTYTLTSAYDITMIFQERTRQFQTFLIALGCVLLFSFFLLKKLSSYLTQPILKLHEASRHIAAGHYEERTNIQSDDEIQELSVSFDEMAQATQETVEQLKVNVAQREAFMSSFSHEIKTPMTAILGFADTLRTYDCDIETRKKCADYIYTEGKRLETLSYTLMDLLSLSKTQIHLVPIKVQSVMNQLKQYYQLTPDTNAQLYFEWEAALVLSKEDLLFTLLRNLIDNAIKASREDQIVLIKGVYYPQYYQISVIDEGIGMSEECIQQATQPFYMADKSRSRKLGGAGLGLSIAQRIVEVHHTSLDIHSEVGKGTIISITLEVIAHETI